MEINQLLANRPSDEQLAQMNWQELMNLRNKDRANMPYQDAIAPYEHRAYARDDVAENPMKALLYAAMIPGYQAAKAVGAIHGTAPSIDQAKQGFIGVYEGLKKAGHDKISSLLGNN